ncbi:MAG: septal ring lytic transglycosylase RlpA family protein, partial [Myxococcota bacterium]
YSERGVASWYGPDFHGRATANGETYDMNDMTAAHRNLPFDSVVEVRNRDNGRKVRVRINDRGPFAKGRIIDLSRAAAAEIGLVRSGVARVRVEAVGAADAKGECHTS